MAFDTGLRPSEQLALGWEHIDVAHKKILVRRGLVRGVKTDLKTTASAREIGMLPTVEEVLVSQPRDEYGFPNADGGPLDLTNINTSDIFE